MRPVQLADLPPPAVVGQPRLHRQQHAQVLAHLATSRTLPTIQRQAQVSAQALLSEQPQHRGFGIRARPGRLQPVQQPAYALARPDLTQDRAVTASGGIPGLRVASQEPDVDQDHRIGTDPDLTFPAAGLEQVVRPGKRLRHRRIRWFSDRGWRDRAGAV